MYLVGTTGNWHEYAVGDGVSGHLPSIDIDPLGYLHIAYWDEITGGLKYATNRPQ